MKAILYIMETRCTDDKDCVIFVLNDYKCNVYLFFRKTTRIGR